MKKSGERTILPRDYRGNMAAFLGGVGGIVGVFIIASGIFGFTEAQNGRSLIIGGLFLIGISLIILSGATIRLRRGFSTAEEIARIMQNRSDRYARAASGSHEGLWDIDAETGSAFFSESWHRMLNLETDSVQGVAAWQERIHPEDRGSVLEALTLHLDKTRPIYEAEYRIKTALGSYLWVSDRGSRSDETPSRVAGFSRNIAREKNVEEALRSRTEELSRAKNVIEREIQNTRKFSQAVESATDPIAIITPSGNVTYANQARATLLCITMKDMVGAHILSPYRKKTVKKDIDDFELALRAGRAFGSENFTGVRTDGSVFEAAISIFPVREKGVVSFFTSLEQDITKRKDIDRAKTEFVSLASHQLRTPLTSIRWYSEMLLKENERLLSDRDRKYLSEIYNANRRMVELINALLNVSRIDLGAFAINPHPTNLPSLVESVIAEILPQTTTKHIRVRKDWPADLAVVSVDPQLFRVVFQNLISNAVKYTRPGGLISIAMKKDGGSIIFSVADDGIGIPEKERERIFTKLFRADNARELDPDGTGLGLYIVKAIMEASGGEIRFESKEGQGTTFYGIIPISGSLNREGTKPLT